VTNTTWKLRDSLSAGGAQQIYDFGLFGDRPLMADFSGSGVKTAAVVRGTRHNPSYDNALTWYIRQVPGSGLPDLIVKYGQVGDIPVVGDWDGDGVATIGVVRGNRWLLRNSNSTGTADIEFVFGDPGDIPMVGDWNADGVDSPGIVRGDRWMLKNAVAGGNAELDFTFAGDGVPVVGDWTGTGRERPGWFNEGTWRLRNSLTSGGADTTFVFGSAGDIPVVWGRTDG
jgi:hypothetical protein